MGLYIVVSFLVSLCVLILIAIECQLAKPRHPHINRANLRDCRILVTQEIDSCHATMLALSLVLSKISKESSGDSANDLKEEAKKK